MATTDPDDILAWKARIEAHLASIDHCCVSRVQVLDSTPSTMDAGAQFAEDGSSVLVVALSQTNGRGQRGRVWQDADRCTLPCTFAIDAAGLDPVMLSAQVGCAVHDTINQLIPSSCELLIKWPNDIMVRQREYDFKLAGILIEQQGDRAMIGIGINCSQCDDDWGTEIRPNAISLAQIGVQIARVDLLCLLIERLSRWLVIQDREAIISYYQSNDAMINTRRSFRYDNKKYDGIVERIDPLDSILVQTTTGSYRLPIGQTQHLRD